MATRAVKERCRFWRFTRAPSFRPVRPPLTMPAISLFTDNPRRQVSSRHPAIAGVRQRFVHFRAIWPAAKLQAEHCISDLPEKSTLRIPRNVLIRVWPSAISGMRCQRMRVLWRDCSGRSVWRRGAMYVASVRFPKWPQSAAIVAGSLKRGGRARAARLIHPRWTGSYQMASLSSRRRATSRCRRCLAPNGWQHTSK